MLTLKIFGQSRPGQLRVCVFFMKRHRRHIKKVDVKGKQCVSMCQLSTFVYYNKRKISADTTTNVWEIPQGSVL